MKTVDLICASCKEIFKKEVKELKRRENLGKTIFYCGLSCSAKANNTKYKTVQKECPVCRESFFTKHGASREKTTCSRQCGNIYFRKGNNRPDLHKQYATVCFTYHEKKCVVCSEDKIVAAHHYDGNHKNDDPENFIPLCPTHHCYWHSKYRDSILEKVEKYRKQFLEKFRVV